METKTENKIIEIQTSFWVMGPTIFELWIMETELWVMETRNPNTPYSLLLIICNFIPKQPPESYPEEPRTKACSELNNWLIYY